MEKELILCDSNIFISWFRGESETIIRLERIGLNNILIPSVTVMELYNHCCNSDNLQSQTLYVQ